MLLTQAEASALAQINPGHPGTYAPDPGQDQGSLTFPDGTDPTVIAGVQTILDGYRGGTIAIPVPTPSTITKLGLLRAFQEEGLWPAVKRFIAADENRQDQWDAANVLNLSDPFMQATIAAFRAQGIPIDPVKLAIRANQLVA